MFRLSLVALMVCLVATDAQAQQNENQEPTKLFIYTAPLVSPKKPAQDEQFRARIFIQQQDYLTRDRKSFDSTDSVQFITPANRPKHQVGSTKVYFGVVFKF